MCAWRRRRQQSQSQLQQLPCSPLRQGGRDATPALGKAMTMAFGLFGLLEEAEPLLFFHGEAYDLLAAAGLAFEQLQLAFLRKRKCNACGVLT
jgi:hypothetical protein